MSDLHNEILRNGKGALAGYGNGYMAFSGSDMGKH